MISQVKLIAEPWDVGEGGYQVGNFPSLWSEWNGNTATLCATTGGASPRPWANSHPDSPGPRTCTRRRAAALAPASTSSPADGFTLNDLVSHNRSTTPPMAKTTGTASHNRSWNCGVEGPTDDPEIVALRHRQMRNIIATMMLSQGTPMISHGDRSAITQQGNNNVYCQDSGIVLDGLVASADKMPTSSSSPAW